MSGETRPRPHIVQLNWESCNPFEWKPDDESYYPVNDAKNQARYEKYAELAAAAKRVIFGGHLGSYRYTDMQDVIGDALACVVKI